MFFVCLFVSINLVIMREILSEGEISIGKKPGTEISGDERTLVVICSF